MNAPNFRPFVDQIDRAFPSLRVTNTYESIGELVLRSLVLAGPEWAHIGKTAPEGGKWIPPGFMAFTFAYLDSGGGAHSAEIVGVSHDAIWHLPTHTQIKVISNSAANSDPDPAAHGVGVISCYEIDAANYRPFNPPVTVGAIVGPPNPHPAPLPPAPPVVKDRGTFYSGLQAVNRFYQAPEGLQRPGGMVITPAATGIISADVEALGAWGYDLMLGATVDECIAKIKTSEEWHTKHPAA